MRASARSSVLQTAAHRLRAVKGAQQAVHVLQELAGQQEVGLVQDEHVQVPGVEALALNRSHHTQRRGHQQLDLCVC